MHDHRTEPGLRDELITEEVARLLAGLDQGQLVEDQLRASDAIERLGKHLLRVARRLKDPNDRAGVEDRIGEVNSAIDALGSDFTGDRIAVPARVLKGVHHPPRISEVALPAPDDSADLE